MKPCSLDASISSCYESSDNGTTVIVPGTAVRQPFLPLHVGNIELMVSVHINVPSDVTLNIELKVDKNPRVTTSRCSFCFGLHLSNLNVYYGMILRD